MKNLKIKTKILVGLGLLGIGYLGFLVMIQWSSSQTQKHMHIAADSLFPAAVHIQDAESSFQRLTKSYNDAVLLQDKSKLDGAAQETQVVVDALNTVYADTSYNPQRQKQIGALRDRVVEVEGKASTTYGAMIDAKDNITDDIQASISNLAKSNKEIAASLQQAQDDVAKDFAQQLKTVSTISTRQSSLGILICLLAIGCGVLASILVERQVSKPLASLVEHLQDIAEGEADLTKRLNVQSSDELGEASRWFNIFMDRLQDIISQVSVNTERLAQGTQGIAEAAKQMADHAGIQRAQINQMAVAMQQMADSVQEISHSSNQAAQGAVEAGELAVSGGTTVNGAMSSIRDVAEATRNTESRIHELGQSAQQIGRIINVIDEIASQTNLLALNAAIEAARAGEQGRGFAVVAGEVRNLAVRTTGATKEIAEMITAIQVESRNAAEAMHLGAERVEVGVQNVTDAGEALHQIIGSAESVQKMITQIATASTEQSATASQVDDSMQEIAKLAEETARGAAQSSSSCQEITTLATDLRRLVSVFRVSNDNRQAASERNAFQLKERTSVFKKIEHLPAVAPHRV